MDLGQSILIQRSLLPLQNQDSVRVDVFFPAILHNLNIVGSDLGVCSKAIIIVTFKLKFLRIYKKMYGSRNTFEDDLSLQTCEIL